MSFAFDLLPHAPMSGTGVHADVTRRRDGSMRLNFRCRVGAGVLSIPAPHVPARVDELWRHTCCEFFVAAQGAAAYREFNFSPSGEWAIYDFGGYRERLPDPPVAVPPGLTFTRGDDGFELVAVLPAELLPPSAPLEFGLAAVLEAGDGGVSYWALAHPSPRPDFHRRAGFVGRLQAA